MHLRLAIRDHVLCGYLFLRYKYGLNPDGGERVDAGTRFRQWVPLIYAGDGLAWVESRLVRERSFHVDKAIWSNATENRVRYTMKSLGIDVDQTDLMILMHYFDAGMVLSLLEEEAASAPEAENFDLDLFQFQEYTVSRPYVVMTGCLMAFVLEMFKMNVLSLWS